jgi:hypothetical protein
MNLQYNERQESCKTYFHRARKKIIGTVEGLNKQFYADGLRDVWTAFDAFLGWKYPDNNNKAMRNKYTTVYQSIFEKWRMSDIFNSAILKLKELSPIEDMNPRNPRPPISLTDIKDLNEILEICYRIRSNLNHGSKALELDDERGIRNRALVEHAFRVSYEILEKTLINEKVIN